MLPKSPKLGKNFTKINVPEDLADSEIGFVGEGIIVVEEPTNIYKPLNVYLEIGRKGTPNACFIIQKVKAQFFVTLSTLYFYLLNVLMTYINSSKNIQKSLLFFIKALKSRSCSIFVYFISRII